MLKLCTGNMCSSKWLSTFRWSASAASSGLGRVLGVNGCGASRAWTCRTISVLSVWKGSFRPWQPLWVSVTKEWTFLDVSEGLAWTTWYFCYREMLCHIFLTKTSLKNPPSPLQEVPWAPGWVLSFVFWDQISPSGSPWLWMGSSGLPVCSYNK